MDRFLIPVEGLTLPSTLDIGRVRLHESDAGVALVQRELSAHQVAWESAGEAFAGRTVAEIEADTRDHAVSHVRSALELLRVLSQGKQIMETTHFGLPGDVPSAMTTYMRIGAIGPDWMHRGHMLGWTFTEESLAEITEMDVFGFVAGTVGRAEVTLSNAERRAALGVRLASRARLEHRADLQILSAFMSIEAMLKEPKTSPIAYTVARRCAYFTCGTPDDDPCGRTRPTCPYLASSPAEGKAMADRARARPQWRCSEWLQVVDWYEFRNDIAHGSNLLPADEVAGKVVYWLLRWLLPSALAWLQKHRTDPVGDLDMALDNLPEPPDWKTIIEGGGQ